MSCYPNWQNNPIVRKCEEIAKSVRSLQATKILVQLFFSSTRATNADVSVVRAMERRVWSRYRC